MTPAIIFADGSFGHWAKAGGWVAVILWRDHRWEIGGHMECASSQEAEMTAIATSLRAIPRGHPAVVFCDEQGLVHGHRDRFAAQNVFLVWKRAGCEPHRTADRIAKRYARQRWGVAEYGGR